MSPRSYVALIAFLVALPAGFAADAAFGDCPIGYDCSAKPDGAPFPPHAVTAHTVYAAWAAERNVNETLGLPTDFAAVAGYFAEVQNRTRAVQRECVVWFNGYNLDQRPASDPSVWGSENAFPSDEDEPAGALQDYDFDRDIENCVAVYNNTREVAYAAYAVVVEQGDCDPSEGEDHRFRGHLDFVDPNDIYHEVQEYDYRCAFTGPLGNPLASGLFPALNGGGGLAPDGAAPFGGPSMSDAVRDLFPWTYTDPDNSEGCEPYETPADNQDIANGDPGSFDLGHKCNGAVQDLFRERMWVTEFHEPVFDPTLETSYNFALQFDTCSGLSIYMLPGKEAQGAGNGHQGAEDYPGLPQGGGWNMWNAYAYHTAVYDNYYMLGLDAMTNGFPVFDLCTDGSSFSFDDTPRGRVTHDAPPPGTGSTEIMRGNSYDFNSTSPTFSKHRTVCRADGLDWPHNWHPRSGQKSVNVTVSPAPTVSIPSGPGRSVMGPDCYAEDHRTAHIDIYVFDLDPTGGLFALNSNGLTGLSQGAFTLGVGGI